MPGIFPGSDRTLAAADPLLWLCSRCHLALGPVLKRLPHLGHAVPVLPEEARLNHVVTFEASVCHIHCSLLAKPIMGNGAGACTGPAGMSIP